MLDRFITGEISRISPEAPVPVMSIEGDESRIGGAGNVAANISALGGHCTLVGVVGDDDRGRALARELSCRDQMSIDFAIDSARPTTTKIRFISRGQNLLRVDREIPDPIGPDVERAVIERARAALKSVSVLVLSDYAKGTLTPTVVAEVIALAATAGVPVVVDPKSHDFSRYAGATVLTPNVREVELATRLPAQDDEGAHIAAESALEQARSHAILLTRAEKGMTLVETGKPPVHIHATAREVFDVVGAGDTVVATLALALGAGMSLADAARIANAAAGVVVGKRGTAVVTPAELRDALEPPVRVSQTSLGKVQSLDGAVALVDDWRAKGYRVGFTNGCFDVLHAGHARLIEFSRLNCDRLILGLNSDASVSRLKGPSRPVNNADDRALLLASLSNVDCVVVFDEDTPARVIQALAPDVLVKGADYEVGQIVGADVVLARGGQVLRCDLLPGRSTTAILARGGAAGADAPTGAQGLGTIVENYRSRLRDTILPFWLHQGFDERSGLFAERMDFQGGDIKDAPHRALVQARQIYVSFQSAALGLAADGDAIGARAVDTLRRRFLDDGDASRGFIHSVYRNGGCASARRESYTHAFILFALASAVARTGDVRLKPLIQATTGFIDQYLFDARDGGLFEAHPGDSSPKAQNPLMHMLEAYLALHEALPDGPWLDKAGVIVRLFRDRLFSASYQALPERFDHGWSLPAGGAEAAVFEPGHHFEWVWLLAWYDRLSGADHAAERSALWRTALKYGISARRICVDEVNLAGRVTKETTRLWPQTEGARAGMIMAGAGDQEGAALAADLFKALESVFLGRPFKAGWIDHVDAKGEPIVNYTPASSLYHILGPAAASGFLVK